MDGGASRPDDWDTHWDQYGEAALTNPANEYRHRLISAIIGPAADGERILDVGSGQGEFALRLWELYPGAEIRGLEYSETGVERARLAALAAGASVVFTQRDLLVRGSPPAAERAWATIAICSEVLEHVDEPAALLGEAKAYLAASCRVIVTVPGGPRTAFDRYIGHRRHFSADGLQGVLSESGFTVDTVYRAGFPFFNLYKLAALVRGRRLVADLAARTARPPSRAESSVLRLFDGAFRWNLRSSPFGWQLVAVAQPNVA
jgi:SAM-dependent methyltransferase